MAIESISDRPDLKQVDARQNPELALGTQEVAEEKVEVSFESARSDLQDMLQFNYGVVGELLGQIAAVSPFRADSSQGKQPEVATQEASEIPNLEPSISVGSNTAASYISGLHQVESMLANHDIQLQGVFDMLALSRSGRKPDLPNHGLEYDQVQSLVNQAESRMHQALDQLPETLPEANYTLGEMLPEFSQKLQQYDAGFKQLLGEVRNELLNVRRKR